MNASGTIGRLTDREAWPDRDTSRHIGEAGVAICITRLDDFRTSPHAATVGARGNIRDSEHLRQNPRPIGTAQFRAGWSKGLRSLKIRHARKKLVVPGNPHPTFH
jgi:hypothetical protein